MKRILVTATIAAMLGMSIPTLAFAASEVTKDTAATPSKADIMARGQQLGSTVCAACHGANGSSAISANPNLAGMPEQYIAKQLAAFKSGERTNDVMKGMADPLSPADMRAVGAYFFAQKAQPNAVAKDAKAAAEGQKIYRKGIAARGVPACSGCHGGAGAGIPAAYPRLAGQWSEYTAAQLEAYASGARKNPQMQAIAARMTAADRAAVSEFIAGMRSK